jgi:hypothetical protein
MTVAVSPRRIAASSSAGVAQQAAQRVGSLCQHINAHLIEICVPQLRNLLSNDDRITMRTQRRHWNNFRSIDSPIAL